MILTAYLLYLSITYLVTVQVGWRFYRNGRPYLLALFRGDAAIADALNRLLLTGYYLLNLGYAALMIQSWPGLYSWTSVVMQVSRMCGTIILTLGFVHCCNMGVLYLFRKRPEMMELKS